LSAELNTVAEEMQKRIFMPPVKLQNNQKNDREVPPSRAGLSHDAFFVAARKTGATRVPSNSMACLSFACGSAATSI